MRRFATEISWKLVTYEQRCYRSGQVMQTDAADAAALIPALQAAVHEVSRTLPARLTTVHTHVLDEVTVAAGDGQC
jgi:hypothetical protein